ncbi:retrotransposon protein, putative, ty1-copia subclass [Tanacetum coccineum]|uniref:Retrotransposon protein, putative, ty1-copia subclass n=1 Tax=Tanacetum coccineum TaxID=301880 RepID=A0ABQ4XEB9_9ASTR
MEMSRVPYALAVGSLMFAMICIIPDIAHAVGVMSWYMAEPGREHWEAVKRILRYIKGTSYVALCFGESDLIFKEYVDSDYAVVAMSTMEAEYVVVAQASKEAVWLKMFLEELGHKQKKITLFCDNHSALYLARNLAFHSKTKHIRDYEIWKIDVKTAFLNGHLSEEVYMVQPEGFVNKKHPNQVCKLKRSIYGLKQASKQWNKRFANEIKKLDFTKNHDEPCVYMKASGNNVTFLILYVDDILIMGNIIPMLQDVKSYLGKCFAMKYLGFNMKNSKLRSIPMQDRPKLSKSQGASTPDEVKRMQRVPHALTVGYIMVPCYTDARYSTDVDDSKSQTGYVFVLNGGASKEAVWIRKFIYGLGDVPTNEEPMKMYCDNTGAITITNKPGITKGKGFPWIHNALADLLGFLKSSVDRRYAVLEGSNTAYSVTWRGLHDYNILEYSSAASLYGVLDLLDTTYWIIIYGVSADVDMAYSLKSGNGLEFV